MERVPLEYLCMVLLWAAAAAAVVGIMVEVVEEAVVTEEDIAVHQVAVAGEEDRVM